MSILSSNLKLLREELSMSVEDLSYRVGISASDIEAYEKGTKIPNASNLIKLCETLRVPYEDVMERDLSEERKTAQQEMKKAYKESKEGEFDWYYGNKKEKRFFVFYMIYFVLGLALAGVAIWFVVTSSMMKSAAGQFGAVSVISMMASPSSCKSILYIKPRS